MKNTKDVQKSIEQKSDDLKNVMDTTLTKIKRFYEKDIDELI